MFVDGADRGHKNGYKKDFMPLRHWSVERSAARASRSDRLRRAASGGHQRKARRP